MPNFSGIWNLKEQVQAIAAGRWTGLPLFELYGWGNNSSGQQGDETTAGRSSPIQIGSDTTWAQVSAGNAFIACVKTDGSLFTWGINTNGQLGHDTIISRSSPVQVGALTDWAQVSAGGTHTACVKTDNTLWTWGAGLNGRLGHADVLRRSSPVQVGALTNWAQVSAGGAHTACVKTDGTLWTWGDNGGGRLGLDLDQTTDRSSPVQVGALTDWAQVAAGTQHTACVKTDGTLWSWGDNAPNGQLGDGTAVDRSSPVQVGALTNWAQVSVGSSFTACVTTEGTLFTWGAGSNGRLGHNDLISRSSPVQVGALTNWAQVSAGTAHAACIKTDSTIFTWGDNSPSGQLGLNDTVDRSSPVQVGVLTSWIQVSSGSSDVFAILQETTN
jgi:alpha-tubulin suppressor-like RCC1 family protein